MIFALQEKELTFLSAENSKNDTKNMGIDPMDSTDNS